MTMKNALFLCSDNAALSIMAEAYLATSGRSCTRVYSAAGGRPASTVHPGALQTLRAAGVRRFGLTPKSWDRFAGADAPAMDLIVFLCNPDTLGPEPAWPGAPRRMVFTLSGAGAGPGLGHTNMIEVFAEIRTLADSLLIEPAQHHHPERLSAVA